MREGVDYSFSRPSPVAIKAAGKDFVVRYVSTPRNPKTLTKGEAKVLRKVGLDIAIVFETVPGRALAGRESGKADALAAEKQAVAAGAPAGSVIYFAVDFDAKETQQAAINSYLAGASTALGGYQRVGVYGSYWVVMRAMRARPRVCAYGWQTYAWSGGQWYPTAQLQQYRNGATVGGAEVDLDRATRADFGQWGYVPPILGPVDTGGVPNTRNPLPGPLRKPAWFYPALKEFLRRRKK